MGLLAWANHLMEPAALLTDILDRVGRWICVALFAIVFAETGLLVIGFMVHSRVLGRIMGGSAANLTRLSPCTVLVVK